MMTHLKYNTLSDPEIFHLMKGSDHRAYSEIYQRYFHVIFRHAYKKMQDEDAAKDVVQDVFTNLWLKRTSHVIDSNLAGYLFKSVRNRVFDRFAHEQIKDKYWEHIEHSFQLEKYASVPTDHKIREQQLMNYIDKQIQELPEKMRRVFELSRKHYLTHREIADLIGTSEGNVSKQVTNALRILRSKLGKMTYMLFLLILWLVTILVSYFRISLFSFIFVLNHFR